MGSYGNTRKRASEKVVAVVEKVVKVEKVEKTVKAPVKKTTKKVTAK